MFGGGSVWGSLVAGTDPLTERERHPPARPIPLEFPSYVPAVNGATLTRQRMRDISRALASTRRPLDIQDEHLKHLNVRLEQDVDLARLVPDGHFCDRPFLYDSDLTAMLGELDVDNSDAYREILRLPPLEGRKKPRLTYARNFFVSLEDMSRYWDTSKDHYYEVEAKEPEPSTNQSPEQILSKPLASLDPNSDETNQESQTADVSDPVIPDGEDRETETTLQDHVRDTIEIPTRPKMKQVYKGQRLGNGEQMSPGTRVAAVRNLVKMVVHKFNCRDFDGNPKDKLRFTTINIPSVFYSFSVGKIPAEMKLARARMVEGPLMAAYCRPEVRFKNRDGLLTATSDFVGERFDFFREIGCLLMLAKQRAREAKPKPTEIPEHQWWASKVRWGGGETRWGQLANEVYEDEDPSWSPEEAERQRLKREKEEELQKQAEVANPADWKNLKPDDLISQTSPTGERPKKKKRSGDGSPGGISKDSAKAEYRDGKRLMFTQPMRRKWYQDWTKIKPNALGLDEKVMYRRIGFRTKEQGGSGWDDVYVLSSVNHHVSLMRLSVHEDYLEWLDTGKTIPGHDKAGAPCDNEAQDPRRPHELYVSRSRFYDLFDIEQRKELLTGIWRVMCWLNRDEIPKEEFDKMEELKRKQASDEGDHHMEI